MIPQSEENNCSVCKSNNDVQFVKIADCHLCKKCRSELSESFESAMSIDRTDYPEI